MAFSRLLLNDFLLPSTSSRALDPFDRFFAHRRHRHPLDYFYEDLDFDDDYYDDYDDMMRVMMPISVLNKRPRRPKTTIIALIPQEHEAVAHQHAQKLKQVAATTAPAASEPPKKKTKKTKTKEVAIADSTNTSSTTSSSTATAAAAAAAVAATAGVDGTQVAPDAHVPTDAQIHSDQETFVDLSQGCCNSMAPEGEQDLQPDATQTRDDNHNDVVSPTSSSSPSSSSSQQLQHAQQLQQLNALLSSALTETDNSYLLQVALPNIKPDDIKISWDKRGVYIEATVKTENKVKKNGFYSYSQSSSTVHRSFGMPVGVNVDEVEVKFEERALKLLLPKEKKEAAPEASSIVNASRDEKNEAANNSVTEDVSN